ncbi:hypothetical protein QFZ77_004719 [Paenibacillus sp. V4I3]|uniref:DUF6843 domain-containing protein n=1 Tax=Paenibacillus sp. V4I3 TaxID=3042305 RepID=UPI00278B6A08|nr:hypothetical protein [Paenibacillus sp. V4I3]MDQ0876060.1 hypothetical protein [Paenibacillus sp. V4I3]
MRKMLGIAIAVSVVVCLIIGTIIVFNKPDNPTHKFLLPKEYTGWVEVIFDQPENPALKQEGNYIVYEVPPSGKIKTSSRNNTGSMVLYYIDNNGKKTKLPETVIMIHGLGTSSGEIGNADGTTTKIPEKLSFFVGTEEQWEQSQPH